MKKIFGFTRQYFRELDSRVFILSSFFTAGLIYMNYEHGLEYQLSSLPLPHSSLVGHYLIFIVAFSIPYLFYMFCKGINYFKQPLFIFLVITAPFIFAFKMTMDTTVVSRSSQWEIYWNQVFSWPARLVVMTTILFVIWKLFYREKIFFGLTSKQFNWKPYLLMLAIMIPLIVLASSQADFLETYPKFKNVLPLPENSSGMSWMYKLLYEISYGTDFFSIELFFRGFLVLGFVRIAGKNAILPMACFYCTIHFGKPLGECISSYFGAIVLGIVTYHTRSIYGGLVVHLGIAWLMELGGYFGNYFK